jgi:hypothetical protein
LSENFSKFTGNHSFANNVSTVTSVSNPCLPLPNTNSSISSAELTRGDHCSSSLNLNENVTNQSVLNAITTAINNHMTPMITNNTERKRIIERPHGESLTSVAALYKIQE